MNLIFVCSVCGSDDVSRCGVYGYLYCNMCETIVEAEVEDEDEDEQNRYALCLHDCWLVYFIWSIYLYNLGDVKMHPDYEFAQKIINFLVIVFIIIVVGKFALLLGGL